jgi:predicted XRE-type DNA-binding protein
VRRGPKGKTWSRRPQSERKARQLALAYAIERAIEAGEFRSYGDVAKALGVTQPRVSQVMNLMLLPRSVQEQMLLGSGAAVP